MTTTFSVVHMDNVKRKKSAFIYNYIYSCSKHLLETFIPTELDMPFLPMYETAILNSH